MSKYAYTLIGIGLFVFFVATGQAIPNLDSMIINFKTLTDGTQSLYQFGFLTIGFGLAIYFMSKG